MKRTMRILSQIVLFMWMPIGFALAQVDQSTPIPGGATAATVVCLQAGELDTGAFATTFEQVGPKAWEEKGYLTATRNRYEETKRSEMTVELFDRTRTMQLVLDFAARKVRQVSRNATDKDVFHILNATDRDGAGDCLALSARSGTPGPAAGANGGNGGNAGSSGGGGNVDNSVSIVNVFVKPGTKFVIPPGTQLTATSGPPCPGQPGFFLCPNKFTCAPNGGVCCPGAGACKPGNFCDKFVNNACISPANPRFCKGTGNPVTGTSLHCAPGKVCIPGNVCI